MKNFLNKIKSYIVAHKIISLVILIIIILIGYWTYGKITSPTGETLYVTSKVAKGTIISSVTDSGQVAALNQINIQPQVSGILTYVGIQPGNNVGSGKLLFSIDNTSAQNTLRNAEASLQSAQIALSKLQIQNSNVNLNSALAKGYDDGFSTVSNTFLDLPGIMNGLNNMFFTSSISKNGQWSVDWYQGQVSSADTDTVATYKQNFVDAYNAALTAYNDNFNNYKSVTRASDNATVETLISQTYNTVKLISSAIKNANNYVDFVSASIQKVNNTPPAIIVANQTTLNTYTSQSNADLQNLLTAETTIQSNKDAFNNSGLDVQSAQLSITQQQNALQNAKDNLSYYSIYAPFDGNIASVPVQKGDNVGSGTTLATLITTKQIADVSLNEVDVAKIQLGQKATLTFNAIPNLTITGKVVQIDSIGAVSSGVVNYNVKISFDTYDSEVKPGMTVNAAIITDVRQDVLTVPNSAVKNNAAGSYVQVFNASLPAPLAGAQGSPSAVPPLQKTVVVGNSNATSTEIISGLNEGDEIVTRIINPANTTITTAPSILGAPGGGNRGGGAIRIGG